MYEITLRGAPPASLTARFPAITWHFAPAATILFRHDANSADVDVLIERLRSIGITPLEIHISHNQYEIRIAGCLGDPMLHYVRWAARTETRRSVLRVPVIPADLQKILKELTDTGIRIDYLRRCLP